MALTKVPIVVYYGDNIPDQPSTNPGQVLKVPSAMGGGLTWAEG